MSETSRVGRRRFSPVALWVIASVALLGFLLGALVLLWWPRRSPPSLYIANLAAIQWIQEPKTSGSLLAVCVRVTRRDGGVILPGDYNVSLPNSESQGLQLSSAVTRPLPTIQAPKVVEVLFFYRQVGNPALVASLDGALKERIPPSDLDRLLAPLWDRMGSRPVGWSIDAVEGMPSPIPPPAPRAGQIDLTNFIMGRGRKPPLK